MHRAGLLRTLMLCLILVAPAVAEDRFFDSDGVRIRFTDQGPRDGEPIVLIHGFTQSIETAWTRWGVIDALDDTHRVIALDCRGHGVTGGKLRLCKRRRGNQQTRQDEAQRSDKILSEGAHALLQAFVRMDMTMMSSLRVPAAASGVSRSAQEEPMRRESFF